MNIFLTIAGGIFGIGAIAERDEKKARRMFAGFIACVIGLIAMKIL